MNALQRTAVFEQSRRFLQGLAYRLLGSRAEAEDVVQDLFLAWSEADVARLENPRAWLTTLCTRRCIDLLRSAHRTRVDYVGTWLPEPIHTMSAASSTQAGELASSLSTAFLLLLERLTPKERAAFLLHDVFDLPYPDVAAALGVQEPACRKLVSRAREQVGKQEVRHTPAPEQQDRLLEVFRQAIATGETGTLAGLLAEEVALRADSGGKVPTVRETLQGRARVLAFVAESLRTYWADYAWRPAEINGARGLLLWAGDHAAAAVTFAYDDEGRATDIYIVRNPDKLAHLGAGDPFLS